MQLVRLSISHIASSSRQGHWKTFSGGAAMCKKHAFSCEAADKRIHTLHEYLLKHDRTSTYIESIVALIEHILTKT